MSMLSRCFKKFVARVSPVRSVIFFPMRETSEDASDPKHPRVSKASGMKWKVSDRKAYFCRFFSSAASAAARWVVEVLARYVAAKVSTTVASQARAFPRYHGKAVPSGRFWSFRLRSVGSSVVWHPALVNARATDSFRAVWREWRPLLNLQLKPCCPKMSTSVPQRQLWGCNWVDGCQIGGEC